MGRLNVLMDRASMTDSGMAFQLAEDEWEKAHLPVVRSAQLFYTCLYV